MGEFPPSGLVREDYIFEEAGVDGAPTSVRLSEVFVPGKDAHAIFANPSFLSPTYLPTQKDAAEPYFLPEMGVYPDGGCRPQR